MHIAQVCVYGWSYLFECSSSSFIGRILTQQVLATCYMGHDHYIINNVIWQQFLVNSHLDDNNERFLGLQCLRDCAVDGSIVDVEWFNDDAFPDLSFLVHVSQLGETSVMWMGMLSTIITFSLKLL